MNALRSWQALGVPVIICGDEKGALEAAKEIGAVCVTNVERNEKGTPFIHGVFSAARSAANTPYLAYLNADILVRPSVLAAMKAAIALRSGKSPFLFSCRRRNIPLGYPLPPDSNTIGEQLNELDAEYGSWDQSNAIDLFLFSRDLFTEIVPLSVGHMQWDNWLMWRASHDGAQIVDGSADAALLHPIHGYASDGTGLQQRTQGDQAAKNREAAAGNLMNLRQGATHYLDGRRMHPARSDFAEAMAEKLVPDLNRELKAGLKYLSDPGGYRSEVDVADCCRTILWRFGYFFPLMEEAAIDRDSLNIMIERANTAKSADDAAAALQDFIGHSFLMKIEGVISGGRSVFIRGCGQAGRRVLAFLARHNIDVAGFWDQDPARVGSEIDGVAVVNALPTTRKKPYVIIGSMFLNEIILDLEANGMQRYQDYTG